MGCCLGRGDRRVTYTGYSIDEEVNASCTLPKCLLCVFCCCVYPCIQSRGGGSYPQPLRELSEFLSESSQLTQDDVSAFHEIQRERVANEEPIAQTFEDVVPQLETGDIILFQGAGFFSGVIYTFTGRWTHAALVVVRISNVRLASGKVIQAKNILLVEAVSHPDKNVDVDTDTYKGGVRIVDLKRRLINSDSPYFGLVKLSIPAHRKEHIARSFDAFYEREGWKDYERNVMHLVRAAFDCGALGHNDRDNSQYFCSHLVGEALEAMGIIDSAVVASKLVPTDFWRYRLPRLQKGFKVQALVFIPRLQEESESLESQVSDQALAGDDDLTIPRARMRPDQESREKARLIVPLQPAPPRQPKLKAKKKKPPPAVVVHELH